MSEETNTGLSFEDIVTWNGKEDTGYSARMKLNRNFDKIKQALNDVGASLNEETLFKILKASFLSKKDVDSTEFLISFLGGAEFGKYVSGLLGSGGYIDGSGNAELQSLILRAFLKVPELRYNRVTVQVGNK